MSLEGWHERHVSEYQWELLVHYSFPTKRVYFISAMNGFNIYVVVIWGMTLKPH